MPTSEDRGAVSRITRRLLLAGFGGMLLLLAFAGIDTIRVVRSIQTRNDEIRRQFLNRNRLLNQIRSDLYLSGTYVRDYLVDPEADKAEYHRRSLEKDRHDMEAALNLYSGLIGASERGPFQNLEQELDKYWAVLQPALQWDPGERQSRSYGFLRDEVYPRRMAMLGIADEIGRLNELQLNAGNQQVADLFAGFRLRLGLTMFVTLGLGLLLAFFSIIKILALERQSAARFEENAQARLELKELSARLVEAQESERRAISRELHDEVGQSLSALTIGLTNLAASVKAPEIEELKNLARRSVGIVRNMTLLLRPSMLDDLGLVPAIQWQAREIAKRSGLMVDVASEEMADLPDGHRTAVYRVVQEALHNCEKHARASEVRVTLGCQQDTLLLSVQDNGCGFAAQHLKGLGLRGMQERIENLGGMLNVESELGRGSLITVRLPLKRDGNERN